MIQLYQFKRALGLPNASPFCMKVETFLRMAKLPYEMRLVTNPGKAPKGKAPFIIDGSDSVSDSSHIIEYLTEKYSLRIDDSLTEADRALAHFVQRTVEERLYQVLVYSRWIDERSWPTIRSLWFGDLPPVVRSIVPALIQKRVRRDLHGHGLGRHSSDQIYAFGKQDLDALAAVLADKDYMMGDKPTTVDAVVHAVVANIVNAPLDGPLKHFASAHPNLLAYCTRMDARYYPDPF